MASVFLHCHRRLKNGKEHRYWSITEKVRVRRGQWVQRHLLYLGEINDSQKAEWTKVIAVFDSQKEQTAELALYPAGQAIPEHAAHYGVQVRLQEFALHRPRQVGRLLDRLPDVGATGTGPVLESAPGGLAGRHLLAARAPNAGHLSLDRSRQRMAASSTMVS